MRLLTLCVEAEWTGREDNANVQRKECFLPADGQRKGAIFLEYHVELAKGVPKAGAVYQRR